MTMAELDKQIQHCQLYPAVMHAMFIFDAAKDDYETALQMAEQTFEAMDITRPLARHWTQIFSILSGKAGGQA